MKKIKKIFYSQNELESEITYTGITKFMPLIICGGFFLLTIIMFIFGPYEWNIPNKISVYVYLFSAFIALVCGYTLASLIKRRKKEYKFNINNIILISFVFFIVAYILKTYATTGSFYPDIIRGLFDSGNAYRISHQTLTGFKKVMIYGSIILSPITSIIVPIFFIYYKSLSKRSKICGLICLILNLFLGIAQGVINAYAMFVFQTCLFLLLYFFSTIHKKKRLQQFMILGVIGCLVISFFGYYKLVMGNRIIADNKKPNENHENKVEINKEELADLFNSSASFYVATLKEDYFLSFLPPTIVSSTNHVVSYLTHGYKGLSLAMQEDFTSSYGLGFSDFLRHNFLKLINKSNLEEQIYNRTYMAKISQKGWETGAVWSTFFIFPASDIGFSLTLVLVFFIGFVFCLSWRDTLESKNIFSAVVFYNCCIMVTFFSANNIIFQNGDTFLTIIIMSFAWMLSRIKYKKIK